MTDLKVTNIPQRQRCINKEHPYVAGAVDIVDDTLGKPQSQVNQERIEDVATLDGKIALEKQRAEGVEGGLNTRLETVEQLAEISIGGGDAQIATASDFDNPDSAKRAKIPTVGAVLDGISEGVFNLTAKTGESYASLQDALTAANTAIPANKKKGGMQLSFVQSSDNKYVQYRLMATSFSTTETDWQGVDEEPTTGSVNLVTSGGVENKIQKDIVVSDTAGVYPYTFISGKTYVIKNNGSLVTLSHRNTLDGASEDILYLAVNSTELYTVTSNGSYLRYGGACNIEIYEFGSIFDLATAGYQYVGIALPNNAYTVQGTKAKLAFLAMTPGTYVNYGNLTLQKGIHIIKYNNETWSYDTLCLVDTIPTKGSVSLIDSNAVAEIKEDVEDNKEAVISSNEVIGKLLFKTASNGVLLFKIEQGKTYIIENKIGAVTYSTRATKNGATIDGPWNLSGNGSKEFIATGDALYLRFGAAATGSISIKDEGLVDTVNKSVQKIERLENLEIPSTNPILYFFEKLSGASKNFPFRIVKGHTYIFCQYTWQPATISTANDSGVVETVGTSSGGEIRFIATGDAKYIRVGTTSSDLQFSIREDAPVYNVLNKTQDSIITPTEKFDTEYNLLDYTDIKSGFNFYGKGGNNEWSTIGEQVIAKFDELASLYSSYVTKLDAAQVTSMEYPDYAKLNGATSGDYLATPTYTTPIYRLSDYPLLSAGKFTGRKKMLIVAGIHGNETMAVVNSYVIAKNLCDMVTANYFKLRSSYEIYIMPVVNGYGVYHGTRLNANGVNINRNFGVQYWEVSGQPFDSDYTGASANSEFETQLVNAITEYISPDVAIDHHNYGWGSTGVQFYSETSNINLLRLGYQALTECSYAFIKGLPSYFGNTFKLFRPINGGVPSNITGPRVGMCHRRWFENGIENSMTLEINNCINYENGSISSAAVDINGKDALSVGEYTVRNQLAKLAELGFKM